TSDSDVYILYTTMWITPIVCRVGSADIYGELTSAGRDRGARSHRGVIAGRWRGRAGGESIEHDDTGSCIQSRGIIRGQERARIECGGAVESPRLAVHQLQSGRSVISR